MSWNSFTKYLRRNDAGLAGGWLHSRFSSSIQRKVWNSAQCSSSKAGRASGPVSMTRHIKVNRAASSTVQRADFQDSLSAERSALFNCSRQARAHLDNDIDDSDSSQEKQKTAGPQPNSLRCFSSSRCISRLKRFVGRSLRAVGCTIRRFQKCQRAVSCSDQCSDSWPRRRSPLLFARSRSKSFTSKACFQRRFATFL